MKFFLTLTRLNDPVTDKDKVGLLLRWPPEFIGFIALMADDNNMDYDSIFALLES